MFEKEAEEYVPNINWHAYSSKEIREEMMVCYRKGAEKANEWHFVKDGLPKELHDVLCFIIHNEHRYFLQGYIRDGRWVLSPLGTYLNNEDVIAWKEIILPEPPKYWDLSTGENNINKESE
jgi:hypothetical protein